jgi:predicted secreted protein
VRNTYNKGKYRSGEWAKHLRPFLKNIGNRKWRRSAQEIILEESQMPEKRVRICRKTKKKIAVKLRLK